MRFSTCDARLRNSAIHVAYSREPQSMRHMQPRFHNPCGIYSRSSAIYAVYTAGSPQSILCNNNILQKYTKFRLIHFGSVSNCLYRSIQIQVSFFQHSTIAALYKKGPGVCRGARPCAPLRFSHISMWIYPLRGAAAYAVIQPEFRNPCGIYGRGLRSPCGYYFPIQNLENISLTRSSPSDSPRIRPRLSYASVRSME